MPSRPMLQFVYERENRLDEATATSSRHIEENFDISVLPDDAIEEITQRISTRVRLNSGEASAETSSPLVK